VIAGTGISTAVVSSFTTARPFSTLSPSTESGTSATGTIFLPGTEDTTWLPTVGKHGWLLLTKDKRIRFNELEKSAIQRYRAREFYLASGNYSGTEMAAMLVTALREMARFCRRYDPPLIRSISKSGKVSLRFPTNS
jgi:hypothetical protein